MTFKKGEPSWMKGRKHTEEAKQKNREKHTTLEALKKLKELNSGKNNPFFGKKQKPEIIKVISRTSKERWKNPEYRANIIEKAKGRISPLRGRKISEEHKMKIRKSAINNPNFGMRGKKLSYKAKQKLKEARKLRVLPKKDTSIEVKIQNFLKQLNIEFFTHQYMKIEHGYQCDILIPSINLVIECDGDYWHKYPVGRKIDYVRTKEMIEKGFKVLRLWEHEINEMSINQFENKLKNE